MRNVVPYGSREGKRDQTAINASQINPATD